MGDMYLEMSKHQGYVPMGCYQDGRIVWGAIIVGHDPCGSCNKDRIICKGRKSWKDRKEETPNVKH